MSWQATAWVSSIEAGGASGKLLLYALANYADENGRTFAGDERIMRDTELSERAVRDWKRKLVEAGLISIERRRRPGGDYDLDVIQLAMGGVQPPANSAGGATGKSCRDHRQMAPPPPANGAVPPAPPYKAEPSVEPPVEPEREAREEDDPKKIEAAFWRMVRVWPGQRGLPTSDSLRLFAALTAEERTEAERMFPHWLALLKAQKKDHVHAPSTYFKEKLWTRVPEPEEEKPTAIAAPPFGPVWSAVRMRALLLTSPAEAPPAKGFMAALLAQDDAKGRQARLTRQAMHGWPAVNRMHDAAESRRGITVAPALEALAALMEPVPVRGEMWQHWLEEHERRGWPWLPDPGQMPVVYFPVGGPDGLEAFEQAVRGNHDAGGREAAE